MVRGSTPGGDVMGYALAEDGEGLASHISSSRSFARGDMSSDYKKELYAKHAASAGGGRYELVDLIDLTHEELDQHTDFQAALAINHQRGAEAEP